MGVDLSQPPRFQNISVVAEGVPDVVSDSLVFDSKHSKVTVTFGAKRKRITYQVGAPYGVDLIHFCFIHAFVEREVHRRGLHPSEWLIKKIETMNDFSGFRLEGLQCLTFTNFAGEMEKYYNKTGIRREVRTSQPISVQAFMRLIKEGLDVATVHRRFNDLEYKLASLEESVKGGNRALLDAVFKLPNELRKIVKGVFS